MMFLLMFRWNDSDTSAGPFLRVGMNTSPRAITFQMMGYIIIPAINLGVQVNIDILPDSYLVDVQLEPINWMVLKIQRSVTDASGPIFHVKVTKSPVVVNVNIQGYIKCFMFSASVSLLIDETSLSFSVSVPIFVIFQADLHVKAKYGSGSSLGIDFSARIYINDWASRIKNALHSYLSSSNPIVNAFFSLVKAIVDILLAGLSQIKVDIMVHGSLSTRSFTFGVDFKVSLASLSISFSVKV